MGNNRETAMKRYFVLGLLLVLMALAMYGMFRIERHYGPLILAMSLLPIGAAALVGLELDRLLPDIMLGVLDAGLLTFVAILGAMGLGWLVR